jgi:hypothetical protein
MLYRYKTIASHIFIGCENYYIYNFKNKLLRIIIYEVVIFIFYFIFEQVIIKFPCILFELVKPSFNFFFMFINVSRFYIVLHIFMQQLNFD